MDSSYRDANAPPPYAGPVAPYNPPEKFGAPPPMHPEPGYPSQGAGYPNPMAQQGQMYPQLPPSQSPQVIHITQGAPTPYGAIQVGPQPLVTLCPSCHKNVKTIVTRQSTTRTHLIALLLCLVGCCLCACVPYCMASCQDASHTCPDCKTHIGIYRSN